MAAQPDTQTSDSLQQAEFCNILKEWRDVLLPSLDVLRSLAGTTEDEFLQIGSQLQQFHARSSAICEKANHLVETVSGEQAHTVSSRIHEMMADMQGYLTFARNQSEGNCKTLERIFDLLNQVSQPLENFQKMYKILRMLSTSTKIESARIGEKGLGFVTLAMDVEKLSHMVNDKSGNILAQRQILATTIHEDLRIVRLKEISQDSEVAGVLKSTSTNLERLESVNERCNRLGALVASVSEEVTEGISEVVSSMQAHDMTRQQVEHVIEALQRLITDLGIEDATPHDLSRHRALVIEVGDVCELQAAQLRHATTELCNAVNTIVGNLRGIASRQAYMAEETCSITGSESEGQSFVEEISRGMSSVTAALAMCSEADRDMSVTMRKVAETIGEITGFVTDIEDIGSEIDLIALNSQIKAAHTGSEGAALGVLAEAIKRLSVDSVVQTEALSQTLTQVNEVTEHLFHEAEEEVQLSASRIDVMEKELAEVLGNLEEINRNLGMLLAGLSAEVNGLTADIDRATSGIDVHETTAQMADGVLNHLERIVEKARELAPASSEFKENLRHMEERYTMQSERRIHEAIASRRSGGSLAIRVKAVPDMAVTSSSGSEFGDNVDLF